MINLPSDLHSEFAGADGIRTPVRKGFLKYMVEVKVYAYGNSTVLLIKVPTVSCAIMTDGDRGTQIHPLGGKDARVPISESGDDEDGGSTDNPVQGSLGSGDSCGPERAADLGSDSEEQLQYPLLAPVVFFYLKQTTRPRSWCLRLVCNPYPFYCQSEGEMRV
ncbi:voltage-dependent T-type calcium channel subunit alpha-1H-like [Erpetoichthys calabaricus]|uniref:voltage-dependent T-type calcium channel subunit alpha-1H-like n=1 Tax=Erpetoichthys calabaricus TaxID=27687 RepID=UPI0022341F75|nr:voltage-dependent T-type calcium channel subunit alpha-1H-like [Erpetoichthys calabaricus]